MENNKRLFGLFALLLFHASIFAQKESNIWFFGNGAGLDFNTPNPRTLKNSSLYTEEGCAAVCDEYGKLLFYTNGVNVWNKTHDVMPNGHALSGGISSTQSCVIVPKPGKPHLYFVFTVDEKVGIKGFQYSLVDMTQNGGLGNVVMKNKMILGSVTEKLQAVPHKNGKDYWIIVHKWNSSSFYSYLVTSKGFIDRPVVSRAGRVHRDVASGNKGESIGQMKISPNKKKLAVAMCYVPNNPVEVFDFNDETGVISNPIEIPTSGYAYGVEFSPNNNLLYVSYLKGNVGVIQFDLTSTDVFESGVGLVKTGKGTLFGAIQLAPDGRIYVAKTSKYIDVIKFPNKVGKYCGYTKNGINLSGKFCVYGLPNSVVTNNWEKEIKQNIPKELGNVTFGRPICGDSLILDAGKTKSVYLWSNGETTKKIVVRKTGRYEVKISQPDNIRSESINFVVGLGEPTVDLGKDTLMNCINTFTLDAKNSGYKYKWSTGGTARKIDVDVTGKYAVTVTNGKCWDRDTIDVEIQSYPPRFKCLLSFNPKNASFNSKFDYSINDVDYFEMTIKSAKGKTVWKTTDSKIKWKGKDKKGNVLQGNFNWIVKFSGPCTHGEIVEKTGTVKVY